MPFGRPFSRAQGLGIHLQVREAQRMVLRQQVLTLVAYDPWSSHPLRWGCHAHLTGEKKADRGCQWETKWRGRPIQTQVSRSASFVPEGAQGHPLVYSPSSGGVPQPPHPTPAGRVQPRQLLSTGSSPALGFLGPLQGTLVGVHIFSPSTAWAPTMY